MRAVVSIFWRHTMKLLEMMILITGIADQGAGQANRLKAIADALAMASNDHERPRDERRDLAVAAEAALAAAKRLSTTSKEASIASRQLNR
jgi:hypothetical protein